MKLDYSIEDENVTDVWRDYDKGRMYNRTHGIYDDTEKNYNFYHGNQWEGAKLGDIQPIVFNIIKPIVKYKLGVITQNRYEIVFNPNIYNSVEEGQKLEELCKVLNSHTAKVWELQKVDQKVREASKDACINSEGIVHNYFDSKTNEIIPEIIDKNNVYYGNENDSDIQNQPYIIITYRVPVSQARQMAMDNGISAEKIELITPDGETQEQAGYRSLSDEVNAMCLVLLKYYKIDGRVYYTRATKNVVLEEKQDTGMSVYPVAHFIWEQRKGSARGIGAVNCIIPNQIEINKIDARRAIAVKIGAFEKLVYNSELVANPKALNTVGGAIEIKGGVTVDDVRKAVGYIHPESMSPDAGNLSAEMKSNTRELEGAGDTATGNVDPTQASGKAILAVQQASQQPLNEQVENYKTFVEDIARIWFDMWKSYEVKGMNVMFEQKDSEGNIIQEPGIITYQELQALEPHIKVDITPRGAYDRYAQELSLENLFMNGKITFEEYVESLPADAVMPKATLEKIEAKRKENAQKLMGLQMQANVLDSAMNQAMELQGGGQNDVSSMPIDRTVSQGSQEQPNEIAM